MAAAVSKFEVVKKNAAAGDGHTVVKLWFWNKNHAPHPTLEVPPLDLRIDHPPVPGRKIPRSAWPSPS